ncbi:hypothetical protein AVEN_211939-1, partial [Araneus ventricosus]
MNRGFMAMIQRYRVFKEIERRFQLNFLCHKKCCDSSGHTFFKAELYRSGESYDLVEFNACVGGSRSISDNLFGTYLLTPPRLQIGGNAPIKSNLVYKNRQIGVNT